MRFHETHLLCLNWPGCWLSNLQQATIGTSNHSISRPLSWEEKEKSNRILGLEPPAELREKMKLQPQEILKLLKGAYGRVDAPYLWYMELKKGARRVEFQAKSFWSLHVCPSKSPKWFDGRSCRRPCWWWSMLWFEIFPSTAEEVRGKVSIRHPQNQEFHVYRVENWSERGLQHLDQANSNT